MHLGMATTCRTALLLCLGVGSLATTELGLQG